MFDSLANVWVFAELSTSTNATLCVYVSDGPSVITASYMLYALVFPQYDGAEGLAYPKLAAFNGYYAASMVYNQTSPVLVIMERTAMILHSPVRVFFFISQWNDDEAELYSGLFFDHQKRPDLRAIAFR